MFQANLKAPVYKICTALRIGNSEVGKIIMEEVWVYLGNICLCLLAV